MARLSLKRPGRGWRGSLARSLALAFANIAGMLAPGGVLLHNETRPVVGELTRDLGLPLLHARTAVIATVRGAATPLYDSISLHVANGQQSPAR